MFESLCLCFASSNFGDAAAGFFPVVFLVASHSEEDNLTPEGWFSWWDEIMVLFQHPAMVPCCLHGLCVLQTVDGLLNSEFPWDVCATEWKCHKQSQINGRKKVYCRKFNTNIREKFQNCFSIFCAEQAVHTHTHICEVHSGSNSVVRWQENWNFASSVVLRLRVRIQYCTFCTHRCCVLKCHQLA